MSWKLRITGSWWRNPRVTGRWPSQRVNNAKRFFRSWRHYILKHFMPFNTSYSNNLQIKFNIHIAIDIRFEIMLWQNDCNGQGPLHSWNALQMLSYFFQLCWKGKAIRLFGRIIPIRKAIHIHKIPNVQFRKEMCFTERRTFAKALGLIYE